MDIAWAVLLVLLIFVFWFLNLIGMPGNWLTIIAAVIYSYFGPAATRLSIGWQVLLILVVLAVIGELVEFAASAAGARRVGGSKRGAFLALCGSILGGILGLFIPVPIPLLGSLILAASGALGGAMLGEYWKGRELHESWSIGKAAFWGRLLGTLGKALAGAVMVVVVIVALAV